MSNKKVKIINRTLRRHPKWQKIDNAPDDGVIILLTSGANVYIGYTFNRESGEWYHVGAGGRITSQITHWMPAPKPPRERP